MKSLVVVDDAAMSSFSRALARLARIGASVAPAAMDAGKFFLAIERMRL
jgi:hypothetical protein